MMLFAVALAAVITVLVGLLGPDEETASQQIASVEPASSEAARREKRGVRSRRNTRRSTTSQPSR